ncbi:hypothetical protein COO60DRAFT_1563339 [Scenedesmus sp. NREL 46B-D3]|nr:hypothetical protein COO60DRAFT_1563339 [Scenedesmus sp. NREL 46B-D3]
MPWVQGCRVLLVLCQARLSKWAEPQGLTMDNGQWTMEGVLSTHASSNKHCAVFPCSMQAAATTSASATQSMPTAPPSASPTGCAATTSGSMASCWTS